MRILAIRGRDLTSLAGDFEIDFEAEPLASAGIFAIVGPTGAGKSTLLDAVCLALFNAVPRLGSASSGSVGAAGGEMVSSGDTRALLRHRAGEGFAEVDFAGLDGGRYRARWSARRARGRPDGALQNVVQTLVDLGTGDAMGGTRTETLAEIRRLIGLSAHQFGRAVMLAQGEFNAFIDADPNTRAELLEKLTGTELYARLGMAARRRAEALRGELSALEMRIAATNCLDDVARASAQAALEAARDAHVAAAADLAGRERDRAWHARGGELARLVGLADGERRSAVERSADAEPRRVELARRRLALSVVPVWQAAADAAAKVEETVARIGSLENEVTGALAVERAAASGGADAAAALAGAERERDRLGPDLTAARELDRRLSELGSRLPPLAEARAAAKIAAEAAAATHAAAAALREDASARRARLADWLEANQSLETLSERERDLATGLMERVALTERISALEAEGASARISLDGARDAYDGAVLAAAATVAALDGSETAVREAAEAVPTTGQEEELDAVRTALLAVEPRFVAFERATADLDREAAALAAHRTQVERLAEALSASGGRRDAIDAELPGIRGRRAEAARAGALSAAASEDASTRLRAALVDGEPCPVCGAREHAVAALAEMLDGRAAADAARVAELDAEISALDAERAVLGDRLASDGVRHDDTQRLIDAGAVAITSAEDALAEARAALATALAACGIAGDPSTSRGPVAERLATKDEQRRRHAAARNAAASARRDFEEARLAADAARSAERAAADRLRDVQLEAAGIAQRLAGARTLLGQVEERLDEGLPDHLAWREDPAPVETVGRLVGGWRSRREELAEVERALPGLVDAAHRADVERERGAGRLADAERSERAILTERDGVAADRLTKLDGEDADVVGARLEGAVAAAAAARDDARRLFESARTELAALVALRDEAAARLERERADAERRRRILADALSAGELDQAWVETAAAAGTTGLDAEEAELAALERAVVAAEAALLARIADRDAHLDTEKPAVTVDELEGALHAAHALEVAARGSLTEAEMVIRQDDAARAATVGLRASLERARGHAQPWLQLDALIGDATGNRFRRYAQGLTLERLLAHANERLAELKPRYSLERAPGGEMVVQVIDNDMAGEIRGLPNLSGGERFLVSLALALGLSEMSTGGALRVESLFIDEGFGSLDGASLGQAIGVLEQLHATGRRVGVISHIDDVKERIAVKIAVSPVANGTSSMEVLDS